MTALSFNVHDQDSRRLAGNSLVTDWLTANGIDPKRCFAFAATVAVITAELYRKDDASKHVLDRNGDPITDAVAMPLSTPMPEDLRTMLIGVGVAIDPTEIP